MTGIRWTCGSQLQGLDPWQSKDCRLEALESLAVEQCGHDPESTTDPLEAIRRELARLREDAARWAYIRDCCAQSHSLHMDGTAGYRLRPIYRHRGGSFAEVVDKAIAEVAAVKAATNPGATP